MAQCAHVYRDNPKNVEKGRVGRQCGQVATHETPFCRFHGGNSEQVINHAREERYVREVREEARREVGFTALWPEDHAMLDPFSLMLWEIRRSGARIEWFNAKIEALDKERDLWWGQTKVEDIGASEFRGKNTTYEARENILVKMQNEERKRLTELRNEWMNNRFEAAKIAGYGAFRASMRNAIGAVAAAFEIDLRDPANQEILRTALEGLPDPILGVDAPEVKAIKPGQSQ